MKKIIYYFAAMLVVLSLGSCKRIGDEDGNLLNDMNQNPTGLVGKRFLFQEVNSVDTIAEYRYTGLKLTKVLEDSAVTDITYNGDVINKVEYKGVVEGDSTVYTKFFIYDPTGVKLNTITEIREFYKKVHATTPPPVVKSKSIYDLTYNTTNPKLVDAIVKRSGNEVTGMAFAYTSYLRLLYSYNAQGNVKKVTREAGPYAAGVFGNVAQRFFYDYENFDDKFLPYTLLPFGYHVAKMTETDKAYYWFSQNNPKKITITQDLVFIPIVAQTLYTYDPQGYALSGFGVNYDYRPF